MSAKGGAPYDKRVQRYAYLALGGAIVLALLLIARGDGELRGFEIPAWAPYLALALALALAIVGIVRRSDAFAGAGAAFLALATLPGGAADASIVAYVLGGLFGLCVLGLLELVHMTKRYERAHRAVERENVPEEHVNRVTDEALRTLASRAGLAALFVAGVVGLAFLLANVGPRQWRAAIETTAPLGVAVIALAVAGAASLFILTRGARFRLRREPRPKELLPDVAE